MASVNQTESGKYVSWEICHIENNWDKGRLFRKLESCCISMYISSISFVLIVNKNVWKLFWTLHGVSV
jgi:hypothetical protein